MMTLFNKIIEIPDDPLPRLTEWIQKTRTRIPEWNYREPAVPDYAAWNAMQERAIQNVNAAWAAGHQAVVGCAVTGFGKTRVAEMFVSDWSKRRVASIFYTHRQAIFEQTHKRFLSSGIEHGCRAAGYNDRKDLEAIAQLAMIPSERAAVKTFKSREHHDARKVIIDEAHANANGFAKELFLHHLTNEADMLLLTATPVNLGDHQAKLVYFGRPSEMRKIGAIVPAEVLAPDEVDLKDIRKVPGGEFDTGELAKRFMVHQVVGSVVGHLLESNPELRPTLLFAPDVESSLWFCDEIRKSGISACSIDGEDVYFGERDTDGQRIVYKSNKAMRLYAEMLHKAGIISVVCNRFVFVMGVDWPWIEHIIFATAVGAIQMWIQACGRGLRAFVESGKFRCIIQDHGGNWHRHPSCNSDIEWCLDDSAKEIEKKRKERLENGEEQEPLRCPRCKKPQSHEFWRRNQGKCCYCGFEFPKSERVVLQTNGKLKRVTGPIYQKKQRKSGGDCQKTWDNYFWRLRNAHSNRPMNFRQLLAWFSREQSLNYAIRSNEGQMFIRDLKTGTEQRLARIPSPESPVWNKPVKTTDFWELQKPPKKSVPAQEVS